VGIDSIHPLKKSASNPLICNERKFLVLSDFKIFPQSDAGRRRPWREWNGALSGLPTQAAKSAGFRRKPRHFCCIPGDS